MSSLTYNYFWRFFHSKFKLFTHKFQNYWKQSHHKKKRNDITKIIHTIIINGNPTSSLIRKHWKLLFRSLTPSIINFSCFNRAWTRACTPLHNYERNSFLPFRLHGLLFRATTDARARAGERKRTVQSACLHGPAEVAGKRNEKVRARAR